MSGLNSVATGLDSVVSAMTGPRRLRSALKQKTAPVRTLIAALDGPGELGMRIPVSVFGGDIFGVMSKQLRDALVFAPPADVTVSKPQRKRLQAGVEYPVFQNSLNSFSPLAHGLKRPTLSGEPLTEPSITRKFETLTESSSLSLPETQVSSSERNAIRPFRAAEAAAISNKQANQLMTLSKPRRPQSEPALVSSLKRYWESIREIRGSSNATLTTPTETRTASSTHVPDIDQPTTPRAWASLVGSDVSAKLRSFTENANLPVKSARLSSPTALQPDRQIQNVFNIKVDNATHAPDYDDLGDRIAGILHEQALQHGIDIT